MRILLNLFHSVIFASAHWVSSGKSKKQVIKFARWKATCEFETNQQERIITFYSVSVADPGG